MGGKRPGEFKIRKKAGRLEAGGMGKVEVDGVGEVNRVRAGVWILLCVIESNWRVSEWNDMIRLWSRKVFLRKGVFFFL